MRRNASRHQERIAVHEHDMTMKRPAGAISGGRFIFFVPKLIFERDVTPERICAFKEKRNKPVKRESKNVLRYCAK